MILNISKIVCDFQFFLFNWCEWIASDANVSLKLWTQATLFKASEMYQFKENNENFPEDISEDFEEDGDILSGSCFVIATCGISQPFSISFLMVFF